MSRVGQDEKMKKIPLLVLCFVFPFAAIMIQQGPTKKVLWAILLQLLGHFPGVIYGILVITTTDRKH